MLTLWYAFVFVASSVTMGLLGFWIGRCARKLPIIDDNLPWTLHRGQMPAAADELAKEDSGSARWPQDTLRVFCQIAES